jgi:hypothetical protein
MDFQKWGWARLFQAVQTFRQVLMSASERLPKMRSMTRVLDKAVDIEV